MNLRIPDDVSLISCDETNLAELATPALTVIDRNLAESGKMAARLVLQHLHNPGLVKRQRIVLPTRLIRRDSCAPPAERRLVHAAISVDGSGAERARERRRQNHRR